MTSGADMNMNASVNFNATSGAITNINAGAAANIASSGLLTMNYSGIMQNVGGGAQAALSADPAEPIEIEIPDLNTYNKKDVIQPKSNDDPEVNNIKSINTVFPSHEPCPEHGKPPEERTD